MAPGDGLVAAGGGGAAGAGGGGKLGRDGAAAGEQLRAWAVGAAR